MVSPEFKNTIKNHLDELAKVDNSIKEMLLKPNKSIEECCNYIIQEVKRKNYTAVADEDVYEIAVSYYKDDSIKDVKVENAHVVVPSNVSVVAEEKEVSQFTPTSNTISNSNYDNDDLFDL